MRSNLVPRALGLLTLTWATTALAAPKIGEKAPAFSLPTVDKGEPRALADLGKGKQATVAVFLSCRCPYVVKARQPIADLVKQFGDKVQFVGINANQTEAADEVKADAASHFAFPMLIDAGSKVADLYAAERTPEAFVIDAGGVLRYHGGIDGLGAALGELTLHKPVSKPELRAMGCTIKRAK
jgi:peroxiredoxin